jgi:hypothetical protein
MQLPGADRTPVLQRPALPVRQDWISAACFSDGPTIHARHGAGPFGFELHGSWGSSRVEAESSSVHLLVDEIQHGLHFFNRLF